MSMTEVQIQMMKEILLKLKNESKRIYIIDPKSEYKK
jgi:hypothetical protein